MKTEYRRNRKKNPIFYHVKLGASSAASNFLSAFGLFVVLLLLTLFFILFQWKNVEIRAHLQEIDRLNQEVLALNAENSRLESLRNSLLKEVPEKARQKMELFVPDTPPGKILVSQRILMRYENKK
ncbi:MAG: hypothetical protein EH225_00125 [Calditrichaeota bacterium]|nr:hypothetical protein [Calditrichota bacterium]RQW08564.1 MAG: hypothetical protein EH225_00125 [Calditrichota bacterium]